VVAICRHSARACRPPQRTKAPARMRRRTFAPTISGFFTVHRARRRCPLHTGACPRLHPHRRPQVSPTRRLRSSGGYPPVEWHHAPPAGSRCLRFARVRTGRALRLAHSMLLDAASALLRHNRWRHISDEAPPCMRWRGLARPRSPARRSLSCRFPGCCPLPARPPSPHTPARNSGFPPLRAFRSLPRISVRAWW
jgi:hypothetical protein